MSTEALVAVLNVLRKEYLNIPVKVDIFTKNGQRMTRITLSETAEFSPDSSSRITASKAPEKKKKTKNPSRLQRYV